MLNEVNFIMKDGHWSEEDLSGSMVNPSNINCFNICNGWDGGDYLAELKLVEDGGLPAASRPTIRIHISFLAKRRLKSFPNASPISPYPSSSTHLQFAKTIPRSNLHHEIQPPNTKSDRDGFMPS